MTPPPPPQPYAPRGAGRKRPHSFKVDDDLWDACKTKAERRRENITDVLIRALEAYRDQPD